MIRDYHRGDDDRWRVPISRTYYTVATPTMLLEIYRDDIAGDWYLQRVIDDFPRWHFRVEVSVRANKEGLPITAGALWESNGGVST